MTNFWIWLRAEWDRVAGFSLVVLGGIGLYLAYRGVKSTPFIADQLTYIVSGGLGGIFCMGVGIGLVLSADMHDEWRKLDRIEAAMRGQELPDPSELFDELHRKAADVPAARGRAVADNGSAPSAAASAGSALALAVAVDRPAALRRALLATGLGIAAATPVWAAGWRQAAQTSDFGHAASAVGVGCVGVGLAMAVVAAHTVWLKWATTRRKAQLFGRFLVADRPAPAVAPAAPAADSDEVFVADGLNRFHRAGCAALRGLAARPLSRRAVPGTLEPCGLCRAE